MNVTHVRVFGCMLTHLIKTYIRNTAAINFHVQIITHASAPPLSEEGASLQLFAFCKPPRLPDIDVTSRCYVISDCLCELGIRTVRDLVHKNRLPFQEL